MRLTVSSGLYKNCLDYYKMAGKAHMHVTRESFIGEGNIFT